MTSRMPRPPFDPELAALLPALDGRVPVRMTAEQLEQYRSMPFPGIEEQIGDRPVECVHHTITGYGGAEIAVSVISREGHRTRGPGIYHIHGGGMVMGDRFSSVYPLVDWAMKYDAVAVTVEFRLAPEHPHPVPVEDCYAGLEWMAAHADDLLFDRDRLIIFGGSGEAASLPEPHCWPATATGRGCTANCSSAP